MLNHYPQGSVPHIQAFDRACEYSDWETTQIEQIEQDFQAALPQIMAEAAAELDDDELAEFIADRQIARMWFAENPKYYGCYADLEMVQLWH